MQILQILYITVKIHTVKCTSIMSTIQNGPYYTAKHTPKVSTLHNCTNKLQKYAILYMYSRLSELWLYSQALVKYVNPVVVIQSNTYQTLCFKGPILHLYGVFRILMLGF